MVKMQRNQGILANVMFGLGHLALLLQLGSCFLLPWMTINVEEYINDSQDLNTRWSTSISIGLWRVKSCVTEGEFYNLKTRCVSMKTVELIDAIDATSRNATVKEAMKNFLFGFFPQKLLTLFGIITTISGIISVFVFIWKTSKMTASSHKSTGIYCILSWLISAVLVLTAVGIQLRYNAKVEEQTKLLTVSEWSRTAVILSVIGGVLSLLQAGIVTLLMLFQNRSGPHRMSFRTSQIKETDDAQEDLCSGAIDQSSITV